MWLLAACSSSPRDAVVPAASGLPSLAEVQRRSAAVSDEFLLRQDGADFAGDLPANGCTADGTAADFAPSWTGDAPALDNAAFAIYRLTFDPADTPVKLALNWSGAPANTECWIAVSNWSKGSWEMQPLPAGNELTLATPANYINGNQQCYVAVIVLGTTQCSLSTIGFGVPVPPVTGDGYTLIAPLGDKLTYLIDMDGNVVHSWMAAYTPGATAKLMENGHLLRAANLGNTTFSSVGGAAGRLTEFDWDGNVVWYYDLSTATQCTHHDFTWLPNGNILVIVWNAITDTEAVLAGRDPNSFETGRFWTDSIYEIEPTLPSGGNIVWQWNVMDHVVQDYDQGMGNYGDPALHPELVDINYPPQIFGDWTHINAVDYNATLDQIMLTTPNLNEVWVIDHSTTTAEAAGSTGGVYGRGGDLLYRWGNPLAYRAGTADDQQLFFGHNGHWIKDGLEGAGDILVFNDQAGRAPGPLSSSVVQFAPSMNPDGSYYLVGQAYGPLAPNWSYASTPADLFYSPYMSSAQRLPGGNTLVCSALQGWLFEVDAAGAVKWEYHNEYPMANGTVFAALRYPYDYPGVAELQ